MVGLSIACALPFKFLAEDYECTMAHQVGQLSATLP